ncbi:UDP-glucosyltransferase 2-like [Anticarsia gemmatalis]|uniref:UDP-glucosyltransferase 2-like n=1 Tax=Anticarsia gemmatalis TaxID=129554 RepID=UPI003F760D8C
MCVIINMLSIALIIVLSIIQNEGAKILAFIPTPAISHQVVFRPLTQELAKRGHEVVVITTDPIFEKGKSPPNFTEIDVHDMSYKIWEDIYKSTSTKDDDVKLKIAFFSIIEVIEMQLKTPEVQRLIKEETFDLLFLEAWPGLTLALSHVFKAPVIQIASFGFLNDNVDTMGASWHPFLYPDANSHKLYNMTKWEKMEVLWDFYMVENFMNSVREAEDAMAKKLFGPHVPAIEELKNNVDMMFLNIHPIWENRPVPSSVIYMWGIHQRPVKELPKDLKTYLDSSKNGVIYMSLGTNVRPSILPPERIQMMVKVFSELPYDVIWKWDKDELPGRSENIRIFKWLPQSDLLRHPKIKLYIMQGGLQSTDEAISAGVPLVAIPIWGDQWYNAEKYVYHKIGVKLDLTTFQEDEFRNAIKTVIGDPSYRQNMQRIRDLMADEPMKPLDRAVWWTEYVLRHGGAKHLRSPAANISWTDYLELELVVTIFLILVTILSLILIFMFYICRCLCRFGSNDKTNKSKTS